MQDIIDFMGDEGVWKVMIPNVVIKYRKQDTLQNIQLHFL